MAALRSILSTRGCQSECGILSRQSTCQEAIARHTCIPETPRVGFCLSTGRCTGASSTRHRRLNLLKRKVPDFVSPTLWSPNSPDLNPDDYSIWSVGLMQDKVYRSRIANVNELEMSVIDE